MKKWKRFKELFKEQFKKDYGKHQPLLYSLRYLFLGMATATLYGAYKEYVDGVEDILDLLSNIAWAIIIALFPFAYGEKESEDKK